MGADVAGKTCSNKPNQIKSPNTRSERPNRTLTIS
jgi:hypothetical protein